VKNLLKTYSENVINDLFVAIETLYVVAMKLVSGDLAKIIMTGGIS